MMGEDGLEAYQANFHGGHPGQGGHNDIEGAGGADLHGNGGHEDSGGTDWGDDWGPGEGGGSPAEGQDSTAYGTRGTPVWRSADCKEFHIVFSRSLETNQFGVHQGFYFVGLRFVTFAENQAVFVGWCSHPDCEQQGSHVQAVYEGVDFPTSQAQTFTGGQALVCTKAAAAVAAWGGQHAARQVLSQHPLSQDGTVTWEFNPTRRLCAMAVRAGGEFNKWGVLVKHRRCPGWFCTHPDSHCRRHVHACDHIKAAGLEGAVNPNATLDSDAFNKKLEKVFDLETGRMQAEELCFNFLPLCAHKCVWGVGGEEVQMLGDEWEHSAI